MKKLTLFIVGLSLKGERLFRDTLLKNGEATDSTATSYGDSFWYVWRDAYIEDSELYYTFFEVFEYLEPTDWAYVILRDNGHNEFEGDLKPLHPNALAAYKLFT